MLAVDKLIDYNKEKLLFLKEYIDTNEMILEMGASNNINALMDLANKKRRLITSIDVIDDKIIRGIAELKEEASVSDLAELKATEHSNLRQLKIVSGNVLKKMVDLKQSDVVAREMIDKVFDHMKTSQSTVDKNKLYYHTDKFFK